MHISHHFHEQAGVLETTCPGGKRDSLVMTEEVSHSSLVLVVERVKINHFKSLVYAQNPPQQEPPSWRIEQKKDYLQDRCAKRLK